MQHLGGYVTIYGHINLESDVWGRPGGGRGGGDELSHKYMHYIKHDHTKIVLKLGQKCNILEKARKGIPQMYMY